MADLKLNSTKLDGPLSDWDPSSMTGGSSWNLLTWKVLGVHLVSWPVAMAALLAIPAAIILLKANNLRQRTTRTSRDPRQQAHLLIVLGSGGHTAELLSMIRNIDLKRYTYRTYLISDTDQFSAEKAHAFERLLRQKLGEEAQRPVTNVYGRIIRDPSQGNYVPEALDSEFGLGYRVVKAPRARAIHQTLLTTPISCLKSFWTCLRRLKPAEIPCPRTFAVTLDERLSDTEAKLCAVPVSRGVKAEIEKLREEALTTGAAPETRSWQVGVSHTHKIGVPDLVLTNGPANGLVVVLAARFIKFWYGKIVGDKLHTIYVESFARVSGLSLSGKIIERLGLADRFIVQWEKGLPAVGKEERIVSASGEVVRRKGGREWRGFLVE